MLFNVKGTTMAEISITGRSGVAAAVAVETGRLLIAGVAVVVVVV